MWTEQHRVRHEAGLKQVVSRCAVEEVARWLERADPPHGEVATPALPVVSAIAWHLRVGGGWRALPPPDMPPWRTVYGWFRRWLDLGLFDRLLCDVACLRRRAAGRRRTPRLGIVDTQSVKCIPIRGLRGFDAGKKVPGRKRVALVDVEGNWLAVAVVPASVQDRDTLFALDAGKARVAKPARGHPRRRLHRRALPGAGEPARHAPPCRGAWHGAEGLRRARASLGGRAIFRLACPLGRPAVRSCRLPRRRRRPALPVLPSCPASKRCSTPGQPVTPQADLAQTGYKNAMIRCIWKPICRRPLLENGVSLETFKA